MAWSVAVVIALVSLIVTAPSSLLVVWAYYRRDQQESHRAEPMSNYTITAEYNPRRTAQLGIYNEEMLLETGPHRRSTRMKFDGLRCP
ncbi:hypothetical protein C8Q69DRAFT_454603 [Paecilomyces variotii]|uniref:Uncharacterized protein n=1 Tax=Byssochlamys spectabilis TaxID=264951 RepID=A0A443I8F3_BYSSP|nr:hypothetical protein C8Q69DRAFT_454603 [Paecilomyces variotii]RWR00355.1 hypothetical protein C8Q69DRAFT_454603 [Paecilomyces variotii]